MAGGQATLRSKGSFITRTVWKISDPEKVTLQSVSSDWQSTLWADCATFYPGIFLLAWTTVKSDSNYVN